MCLDIRCRTLDAEGINAFPTLKTDNVGNGFILSEFQTIEGGRQAPAPRLLIEFVIPTNPDFFAAPFL